MTKKQKAAAKAEKKPQTQIEKLAYKLPDVLPAASVTEIASKLSRVTRSNVSVPLANLVLNAVRSDPTKYTYTVPHVKRGPSDENEERYFLVYIDHDGTVLFDRTPENLGYLHAGAASTVAEGVSKFRNEAIAVEIAAASIRSTTVRARVKEWADDMAYLARKGTPLLEAIKAEIEEQVQKAA